MVNSLVLSCCYGNQRSANEAIGRHLLHSESKTFLTVYHRKFRRLNTIFRKEICKVSCVEFVSAIFRFISVEGRAFGQIYHNNLIFVIDRHFVHVACVSAGVCLES